MSRRLATPILQGSESSDIDLQGDDQCLVTWWSATSPPD